MGVTTECISVCVCTFKRPGLLARLLDGLASQILDGSFDFELVITDNDRDRSAEPIVRRFSASVRINVTYDCEPEQNISLARNRAIRNAKGTLVALIDDDECPAQNWLALMSRALRDSGARGVLGPVLPDLPPAAPRWLRQGRFFDRTRHSTGTQISARDARTGNCLVFRSIFVRDECWFDPAFGKTGGEDSDFFARQFRTGGVYVWCDEAVVYEWIPPERWTGRYHIKRGMVSGMITGSVARSRNAPALELLVRNIIILVACSGLVVPSILLPKHWRIRILQKAAYCGGLVASYAGLTGRRASESLGCSLRS